MAIYEVRRKILDYVNDYILPRGAYIDTGCSKWVSRFGADLKKADFVPNGVKPHVIEVTVEDEDMVVEAKKEVKEEEPAVEAPEVRRTRISRRGTNKAVLDEQSDLK